MYTFRINRPTSVPLSASLFIHLLISSISTVSTLLFCASVVYLRRGILLRPIYPMNNPVVNNSECRFWPHSSKFLNIGSQPPMLASHPLSLENKTPFLLLQITSTIDYLTNMPSCWHPDFCLICQQNTMLPLVFFTLKSPFECNHHFRDAMIISVLPEHIQTLDYNKWNILPSQIHEKENSIKFYLRL